MKKNIFISSALLLLLSTSASAEASVTWLTFKDVNECKANCEVLKKSIRQDFKEVNDAIKEGLTTLKPEASYSLFDLNKDDRMDFIVTIGSVLHCGSAGCMTFLLLSKSNGYEKVFIPHTYSFQSKQAFGVKKPDTVVLGTGDACGYWTLNKNELVHIKNSSECN